MGLGFRVIFGYIGSYRGYTRVGAFPKLGVPFAGGLRKKNHIYIYIYIYIYIHWGLYWGSPYLGKLPYIALGLTASELRVYDERLKDRGLGFSVQGFGSKSKGV